MNRTQRPYYRYSARDLRILRNIGAAVTFHTVFLYIRRSELNESGEFNLTLTENGGFDFLHFSVTSLIHYAIVRVRLRRHFKLFGRPAIRRRVITYKRGRNRSGQINLRKTQHDFATKTRAPSVEKFSASRCLSVAK